MNHSIGNTTKLLKTITGEYCLYEIGNKIREIHRMILNEVKNAKLKEKMKLSLSIIAVSPENLEYVYTFL